MSPRAQLVIIIVIIICICTFFKESNDRNQWLGDYLYSCVRSATPRPNKYSTDCTQDRQHDLSVLAIRRTMKINSRPTEIIMHVYKQSGDLRG